MAPFSSTDAAWSGLSRRAALRLLGALPLALAGCGAQGRQTHVVEMVSEGGQEFFRPALLHIAPDDTVRWTLHSGFHSATAYHPDVAGKPRIVPQGTPVWDSGLLRADGARFERRFQREGAYAYYCTPHEALGMVGLIVVGSPSPVPLAADVLGALPKAARVRLVKLFEQVRGGEQDSFS